MKTYDWLVPSPIGSLKLKFDRCFLGNPRPLGIRGVIKDHSGTVLKVCSKPAGMGSAIEVNILALFEGLVHVKALCRSNLTIEGDFNIVISLVSKKERG